MGYMKEYKLQKEDYELIEELLVQHIRSVNNAIDSGDNLIEPLLAEVRDQAVRTKLGILYLLEQLEEKEEETLKDD